MQSKYWKAYQAYMCDTNGHDLYNHDPEFDDDMYQCEKCGRWFPFDTLKEVDYELLCEACAVEVEWEKELRGEEDEDD